MELNIDIEGLIEAFTSFGLKLVGVVLLLIGAWIIARWTRHSVKKSLQKTRLDVTLTKFFSNITGWLILVLAVLTALSVFGINTTSFAAVIGAAGLAIGLAFQGTLSNFAAGVMLLTFRPFKVGDAVQAAGQTGVIDEIDLLMTKMDTFDNRRIVIPNSKIFGDVIETITFHERRRVDIPVGVDYGVSIDETRAVLEASVANLDGTLAEPPPQIYLDSLGDSSVNWIVRVWCKTTDYHPVRQATIRTVKKHLDEAGISIPFPQLDVHLDGALSA